MAKKKAAKKKASVAKKPASSKTVKKKKAAKKATKKTSSKKAGAKKAPKATKKKAVKKTVSVGGTMPQPGEYAPDFELVDGDGAAHRLSDCRGKRVVLYFYPRDNTPGCTKEACGFRDTLADINKHNALVFGVSPDKPESHQRFSEKFNLPFPLLSDPEHAVAEQYGAWGPKNMYGKTVYGIIRSTFIIDADGRIARVFPKVKAEGHERQVLGVLETL
jgi:peroxiredoxin Q/BCP